MWHAVDGTNKHVLIATPWNDDHEKDIVVKGLRRMFAANQVKRYAFIVEAWVAEVKTLDGPRPSEHPDRREVLMIHAEDRSGESIIGYYYILRPEHGPPSSRRWTMMPTTRRLVA